MTDGDPTRATMTDALARLRREDVPNVEFLVLQEVMGWVFSEDNPRGGYDRHHAALLGGALFTGLDDAAEVSLETLPDETPTMAAARDRLVAGAHELASHGEAGLDMLVEQRIVPAIVGELERSAGQPTTQGARVWTYLLYGVAMGERHDQDEQVMAGFLEAFHAWSAMLASL